MDMSPIAKYNKLNLAQATVVSNLSPYPEFVAKLYVACVDTRSKNSAERLVPSHPAILHTTQKQGKKKIKKKKLRTQRAPLMARNGTALVTPRCTSSPPPSGPDLAVGLYILCHEQRVFPPLGSTLPLARLLLCDQCPAYERLLTWRYHLLLSPHHSALVAHSAVSLRRIAPLRSRAPPVIDFPCWLSVRLIVSRDVVRVVLDPLLSWIQVSLPQE